MTAFDKPILKNKDNQSSYFYRVDISNQTFQCAISEIYFPANIFLDYSNASIARLISSNKLMADMIAWAKNIHCCQKIKAQHSSSLV